MNSKDEAAKCDFMTWDVPVKDDCPVCGHTMVKKAGRGFKKPFCINPACANFLPEEKRGYPRKKTADSTEGAEEPAEKKPAKRAAAAKKADTAKTTAKKTAAKKPAAKTAAKKTTAKKEAAPKTASKTTKATAKKTVTSKAKKPAGEE